MAWWMAIPAIVSAAASAYSMFKGGDKEKTSQTTSWDNPYIQSALKRMDYTSQYGYRPEILNQLRQSTSNRYAQEASGLRSSTSQRLMRQNVPVQVQNQILGDLSSKLGGERMAAMSNIDMSNEQLKMQALQAMLEGGKTGSTTDYTYPGNTGAAEGFGSSLGQLSNVLMMMQMFGNNTKKMPTNTYDLNNSYGQYQTW